MAAQRATRIDGKSKPSRRAAGRAGRGSSGPRPRRRDARIAFEALSIEGGLLSADWLARVAALEAGGQTEVDYRVPKGLQLRDEIGRYWRIAQAHWSDFAAGRDAAITPEAARALAERFVVALLRESFGFESLAPAAAVVLAERSYPIGWNAVGSRVPVVIAPAAIGLESSSPTFGDGSRRRTAFGLAQEYLNAAEGATWGLASDGLTLRVLRDNASLTRPAWIEASIERIFTEHRYADFTALWLLAHETRFGLEDQPPTECALERWRDAGREEGTRAREHLRRGVEEALEALGQGFPAHRDNDALRAALHSGALPREAYFQQLLRLVYRLIFLLTVEERDLLHPETAPETARRLYAEGYALRRLRERAVRRNAHDRYGDLWEAVKIVFHGLASGEPRLGLPALAGLFATDQTPSLDTAKLENRALLLAVFKLAWLREPAGLVRVNWRDMGPEELGSVYEGLLELVPQPTDDGRGFRFAAGGETKGNARKTSGSYYTPDSLVQVLLDSALEPVVVSTLAANPERPVQALLDLSVVDPACGSGHFLLASARRLAGHVARLQANGTPSAREYRHALRHVVGRCLYGVDLNPMAVELCKVSLWMEAVEPGLPLTFLDAHVRHGNALIGTTPELMVDGIPDAAWEPIEGDDRKVASVLSKRNKVARGGQRTLATLWGQGGESEAAVVARAVAELEASADADLDALDAKEARWEGLLESEAYRHQKLVADAWCAAFVWPKQAAALAEVAPTNDLWLQIRDRKGMPPALTLRTIADLAEQHAFFHWQLAFPQVFERRGFDVVIGNPPWERNKPEPSKWFSASRPDIAEAQTSAARDQLIAALAAEDPALYASWMIENRRLLASSHFLTSCGRYARSATGKFNLGSVFVDLGGSVLRAGGRCGMLNISGIATDDAGAEFISDVMTSGRLVSLFDFENKRGLFPEVHASLKFCAVTLRGEDAPGSASEFVFFAHDVNELRLPDRRVRFTNEDIDLLNPLSRTCPVFRNTIEAGLVKHIYLKARLEKSSAKVLFRWNVRPTFMFVMSDHSALFASTTRVAAPADLTEDEIPLQRGADSYLPLFESKMFHQFDHRWRSLSDGDDQEREVPRHKPTHVASPRYWMKAEVVATKLPRSARWLMGVREVTNATNERTAIATVLPAYPVGHNAQVLFSDEDPPLSACFVANFNSLAFDFAVRSKVGGSHLSSFILRQLPVLPAEDFVKPCLWADTAIRFWLLPRVLELTYTAWDLELFARDVRWDGPPFRWNPDRRFLLRAELDAAFFHLYGLSRDDTAYILDTFPIVRKKDERAHGEFRTKRVTLEIYDALAKAVRTGVPYATRLDPPPADPRVAHPPRVVEPAPPIRLTPRRPLPQWSPRVFEVVAQRANASLQPGDWSCGLSGDVLGEAALAAVLRNLAEPRPRAEVERAVVLAVLPRLMLPAFGAAEADTWRSLVGAAEISLASVNGLGIHWRAVVRRALQRGVMADAGSGRWEAGAEAASIPSEVLDARATVALSWIATAPVIAPEILREAELLDVA